MTYRNESLMPSIIINLSKNKIVKINKKYLFISANELASGVAQSLGSNEIAVDAVNVAPENVITRSLLWSKLSMAEVIQSIFGTFSDKIQIEITIKNIANKKIVYYTHCYDGKSWAR